MPIKPPRPPHFAPQQPPPAPPADPRAKRYWRLRWEWLLIILAILFVAFLLKDVQPAFAWSGLQDAMGVRSRDRHTQLAVLGLVLVAIIAVRRVLRDERRR